jgi:hypothetical protein
LFDPDFVRAERVLNKQTTIERDADSATDVNVDRYLIKWAGLGYTQATWEDCDVVPDGARGLFASFIARQNSYRLFWHVFTWHSS